MIYSFCLDSARRASPLRAALLGLAAMLAAASPTPAQAPRPRLMFSARPDLATAANTFLLRPNAQEEIFLFVKNEDKEMAREVTVEMRVGGVPKQAQKVQLAKNEIKRVILGAASPAAPGAAPQPPQFEEAKGDVTLILLDDKAAELAPPVKLTVARPADYLEVEHIRFFPATKNLAVLLKVKKPFPGKARVDLVLRPDRIPALVPDQTRQGVWGGYLLGDGSQPLALVAENLKFAGNLAKGLVHVTIDGYERAFTYELNVNLAGSNTPAEPRLIEAASLLLDAPQAAAPQAPVKIGLEVDNANREERVKLDVQTQALVKKDGSDEFILTSKYNEVAVFKGDRQERLFLAPGQGGGLLFRAEVRDWQAVLDLSAIHGDALLRLQLLDEAGKPVRVRDSRLAVLADKDQIVQKIELDEKPPESVRFIGIPKDAPKPIVLKVARPGQTFPVLATSEDTREKIARVDFYLAKPLPDGKFPADVTPLKGTLIDASKNLWGIDLTVSRTQRDPIDFTVRFVKRNGLAAGETVRIDILLTEPPAAGAGEKCSITGVVVQGDRLQGDIPVVYQDAAGNPKGSTVTDAKGQFQIKGLDPGTYQLIAVKTADNTRARAIVQVGEGEQKVLKPEESLKLMRR